MSDAGKSADHLKYAAEKLEEVQTHLRGASRNAPCEEYEEIIECTNGVVDKQIRVMRDMVVFCQVWEKGGELDKEQNE